MDSCVVWLGDGLAMNVPAKTTSEIRRSFLNNFRRRLMDLFDSILRTVDRVEADKDRRRREEEQRAREVQAERERSAWEVQQRAAAATLGGTGGAKGSGGVNGKSATAAATTESAGRVAPKRQPGKGLDYDALMALAARATTGGNAGATVPATNTSSSSSTATTSQLVKVSKAPVPALDSVRRRGSVANNRMPPSTARRSASLTKAYRAAGAAPQPAGRAPKPAMESAKTTSTGLVVVPARGKFGMHAIQSGLAAASNGKRSIYAKQQAQPAAKIARAGVNMGEVVVLNTVKRDLRSVDQIQTDIRMRKLAAQEAAAAKDKTNNAARNVSPVTATKPLSVKLIVKEPVRGFAPSLDEKQVNAKATSIMPVAKATSAKPATTKTPTKPASKLVTAKSSSANKSVSPRTNLPPPPSVAPKSATKRRAPLPPHVEEVDPRLCDESYVQSNYKDLIRGMFGTKRQYNDDDDEDDVSDDMEATYDEIEREERKSTRLGKLEDRLEAEREAARLKRRK